MDSFDFEAASDMTRLREWQPQGINDALEFKDNILA